MAKKNTEIEEIAGEISLELVVPQARMLINETQEKEMQAEADKLLVKYPADFTIKTKADYEGLKSDLRKTVKMRTQTDEWRKSIKRVADEVSDKIQRLFDPAEKRMAAIKKQYDDAEAERLRIEKEAREKLIDDRKEAIYAVGGVFNGSAYVVGDAEIFPEDLPTDGFEAKLETMKAERVRLDEEERLRKAEAERLRLEEAERVRLAKIKADEDAREIAELREKQRLQDEELARLRKAAEVPVVETKVETVDKKVEPPFTVTTPSEKVVEVARDLLAVEAAPLQPTHVSEAPFIIEFPADPSDRKIFIDGAKAALGLAKRRFTVVTEDNWRNLWREFQKM